MAAYDLLIKGGTIVDGTRLPRYRADVGIKDGRVAEIGRIGSASGNKVLDAQGMIVAPGFVDLHTHYDSQIQWDPWCSISGWHGVTSVVLGNCGFGFAPVRKAERDRAMLMMSRNEAVPIETMREGMIWDWVTFPEYMSTLDRIPKGVNCIQYFPISPLLIWTMGLDAAKKRSATEEERSEMRRLLLEGLEAGACGWSIQRFGENSVQRDYDGTPMPTDVMSDEDVLFLGGVLAERDEGSIQIAQATGGGPVSGDDAGRNRDFDFLERLAEVSGRPILYNVVAAFEEQPTVHRAALEWIADCNRRGLQVLGQGVTVRDQYTFTLSDWNMYDTSEAWRTATLGSLEERRRKLSDPAMRERLIADERTIVVEGVGGRIEGLTVQSVPGAPNLDGYVGRRVGDIAAEEDKHPVEVFLDVSLACDLKAEFLSRNFVLAEPEIVREILSSPYTWPGTSDGGAHTKFLTAGSYPTDFLEMVRDAEIMSLEEAHFRLSTLPAWAAGFRGRGTLEAGRPADVVVYDLNRLERLPSEIVHDYPANEWRRVRRAKGYAWTVVNGEVTFEGDECTGATPGKLLRHGRDS